MGGGKEGGRDWGRERGRKNSMLAGSIYVKYYNSCVFLGLVLKRRLTKDSRDTWGQSRWCGDSYTNVYTVKPRPQYSESGCIFSYVNKPLQS